MYLLGTTVRVHTRTVPGSPLVQLKHGFESHAPLATTCKRLPSTVSRVSIEASDQCHHLSGLFTVCLLPRCCRRSCWPTAAACVVTRAQYEVALGGWTCAFRSGDVNGHMLVCFATVVDPTTSWHV